jgi:hypothetical protein
MIIERTRPNMHEVGGVKFHPGSQFVADEIYLGNKEKGIKPLRDNPDFNAQVKAGLLVIKQKPDERSPEAAARKTLADAVAAMSEKDAIAEVAKIIDATDLQEIATLDPRRAVKKAAEAQKKNRQQTMTNMAPVIPAVQGGAANPIDYSKDPDIKGAAAGAV